MKRSTLVDIISCLFILLFLYTGLFKELNYESFKAALEKSAKISMFAPFLARAVPLIELSITACLLVPLISSGSRLRNWGLYSAAVLMLIFTVYVWTILKFSHGLPCTCGGIIQQMNWHQHLYFNAVFTALAITAIWLNKHADQHVEKKLVLNG